MLTPNHYGLIIRIPQEAVDAWMKAGVPEKHCISPLLTHLPDFKEVREKLYDCLIDVQVCRILHQGEVLFLLRCKDKTLGLYARSEGAEYPCYRMSWKNCFLPDQ